MTKRSRFPLLQMVPGRVYRLRDRLQELCWSRKILLDVEVGPVNVEHIPSQSAQNQVFHRCESGEYFAAASDLWSQCWFRVQIPEATGEERGRRYLRWDGHGEVTVYHEGAPWSGIDIAHRTCPLPDRDCTLFLDCGIYQTAIWCPGPEPDEHGYRFEGASIMVRDELAWLAFHDVEALLQLMDRLLEDEGIEGTRASHRYKTPIESVSPLLRLVLGGLDRACDDFDSGGLPTLTAALAALYELFEAEWWQLNASLIGHAHLDLVWLWPEHVTYRKAIHTFSTALRLMDRDESFTFMHTSPCLYEHIERQEPQLAAQIRDRLDQGRWEATGAFEVEVDTYIPCGEGQVRALAYGQRRFQELRGGRSCKVAWLPDVFGYSQCLPQLLALGGCESFFTTKMTWSPITRFPHHSFLWRGPDGGEVVAHLCSTGYNRHVLHEDLVGCSRSYRQADVHGEVLLPHGFGDGAGGPTEEMLERARRFANLSGTPRSSWTNVESFFDRLATIRDDLPVYQGELYLETHRGTLTSQSRFKAAYRSAERALQVHEAARVAKRSDEPLGFESWRRLLFAQFHDALPGSSIGLVYDELTPELEALAADHLEAAGKELEESSEAETLVVFNPLLSSRICRLELDPDSIGGRETNSLTSQDDSPIAVQHVSTDQGDRALATLPLEGLSSRALLPSSLNAVENRMKTSAERLENEYVSATFSSNGQLRALSVDGIDLPLAEPLRFELYEDHPVNFDAWDIDRHSLGLGTIVAHEMKLEVVETGPVLAVIKGRAQIGEASTQVIGYELWEKLPYLFMTLDIDWKEEHKLLKLVAPTSLRSPMARYGSPFGSIERPQVPGREVDEVQWEVAGSRWAAVGDADQRGGLAIMTEAKYGFACREGDLSVSLLRAPTYPDPRCDRGRHTIRLALGLYRAATDGDRLSTSAATEALFTSALDFRGDTLPSPPFDLDDLGSLVPSWVAPSETGPGFVIRLHEAAGRSGEAFLKLTSTGRTVTLVDLLEHPMGELESLDDRTWRLDYSPSSILSVLVR